MKNFLSALLLLSNDLFLVLYESSVLPVPSLNIILFILINLNFNKKQITNKQSIYLYLFFTSMLFSSLLNKSFNYLFYLHFVVYIIFFLSFGSKNKLFNVLLKLLTLINIYCFSYIIFFIAYKFFDLQLDLTSFKYYPDGRFIFIFLEPLYLGIWISICMFIRINEKKLKYNRLFILLYLITIIFTQSITAFIIILIPLFIFTKNLLIEHNRTTKYITLLIFVFTITQLTGFINFIRIENIFQLADGSTAIRLSMIIRDLEIFKDHFFLGVGFGNTNLYTSIYPNLFSSSLKFTDLTYSIFLTELLAGSGFISFILFILYLKKITKSRLKYFAFLILIFTTNGLFLYAPIWIFLIYLYHDNNNRLYRESRIL